jgi:hypothetical protein
MTEKDVIIDPIKEAYVHRYDVLPENIETLTDSYPSFPSRQDIEDRITAETAFPLVMAKPYNEYAETEISPSRGTIRLNPEVVRPSFSGTDEELEAALSMDAKIDSSIGIQLADERLQLPKDVHDQAMQDATERAAKASANMIANSEAWWLNSNWKVDKDIAEGRLTEAFEFSFGDKAIRLVNLDKPLTDEVLENIGIVLDRVVKATEGSVLDRLNTILLQHHDRFVPGNFGEALGHSGVFRLNTIIVDLNYILEQKAIGSRLDGISYYQQTLAHEIGHLMDISDMGDNEAWEQLRALNPTDQQGMHYRSAFGPLLGWQHAEYEVTDEEGQKKTHRIKGIGKVPTRTLVMGEDGLPVEVDAREHFGEDVVERAVPVSPYGYSKEEEDFAEAFANYALAGEAALDPVRLEALKLTMKHLKPGNTLASIEDIPMQTKRLELNEIDTTVTVPEEYPVSVFIDTNWRAAPDFLFLINPPTDEELLKSGQYKKQTAE